MYMSTQHGIKWTLQRDVTHTGNIRRDTEEEWAQDQSYLQKLRELHAQCKEKSQCLAACDYKEYTQIRHDLDDKAGSCFQSTQLLS
ncbi:hypothetical protein NDU88_000206 [Pleurodeles waltl]|uniref:Uncharacterized protein n=1 Tax=Pleurodeles waltl TaxID=8319 RepID=A0AAV7P334_PLEWA|nr:hypothetical protein NDU88_000206 [Pleurodeles waltl]